MLRHAIDTTAAAEFQRAIAAAGWRAVKLQKVYACEWCNNDVPAGRVAFTKGAWPQADHACGPCLRRHVLGKGADQ